MADNETLHQEGAQAEPEIEVTKEETEMTNFEITTAKEETEMTDYEITTAKEETEMTDFEMSKTADKKDRLYFEDLKTAEDVKAYNAQKELREIMASFLYDENILYKSDKTHEDYIFIDTDCGKDKNEIIDYARKMAKQYL